MKKYPTNPFYIKLIALFFALLAVAGLYHTSSLGVKAITPTATPTTTVTPSTANPTQTQPTTIPSIDVNVTVDKTIVEPGENFEIKVEVENKGIQQVNNLEIRVPFLRTIKYSSFVGEKPSFNKILDSLEYPAGFHNRSWIINTILPNEKRTFSLIYSVEQTNEEENLEIKSSFKLPVTWVDPADLSSNKNVELDYLRLDVYINRYYYQSISASLPKYDNPNVPISKVKLPEKYLFSDSRTTDLSKINKNNYASVENFTLDTPDVLLEFQKPVDLSEQGTSSILSNLDDYINLSWGEIKLKKEIKFLKNIPLSITFKNTSFVLGPKLEVKSKDRYLELSELNGLRTSTEVVIKLDNLTDVSLIPEINVEKNIYETEGNNVKITGTVSDPKSTLIYKTAKGSFTVESIDPFTGEFSFDLKVDEGDAYEVELVNKIKNGKTVIKSVIVRSIKTYNGGENSQVRPGNKISVPVNTLSIALVVSAIVALLALGIVSHIMIRSHTKKKNELDIDMVKNIVMKSPAEDVDDRNLFPVDSIKVDVDSVGEEKINLVKIGSSDKNRKVNSLE